MRGGGNVATIIVIGSSRIDLICCGRLGSRPLEKKKVKRRKVSHCSQSLRMTDTSAE